MRALVAVSMETFLRLRRDKIFVPAALVGCGLLLMSGLASYWGVEEFFKILYDLGSFAWLMTGPLGISVYLTFDGRGSLLNPYTLFFSAIVAGAAGGHVFLG